MKMISKHTCNMTYFMTAVLALSAMTACEEKDMYPDTGKDWEGTTDFFLTEDERQFTTYYKPYVGNVGDPMPFYDPVSSTFKVLYLQDFEANREGTYHPIWGVETADGASYASLGEIVPCGTIDEQDAALGTGCAVYDEQNGLYYIYYTGNKYLPSSSESGQVVMRAVSRDFRIWTKDLAFSLRGIDDGYSRNDFRDPCIFQDDDGRWHMLVSTMKDTKGVLAEYVSDDLDSWTCNGDFMPMMWDRFYECPDVFKMGEWWYMVYSEKHSSIRKVQYFKGKTIDELKSCTLNDAAVWPDSHEGFLDTRAFYAGKTASDGKTRLIWGWCPTRTGMDNTEVGAAPAEPNWGGAMVCHELRQNEDGTLVCVAPESVKAKYAENSDMKVMSGEGYRLENGDYIMESGSHILFSRLSAHNRITFTAGAGGTGAKFAVSFARGGDSEKYYSIVVNPEDEGANRKINFEEAGPEGMGFIEGIDSYKFPTPQDNIYDVTVITDNSVCTVYINDTVVFTNRIYGIARNCWSLDCLEGNVTISNLSVTEY